jgi:diguanylate cyclase (GGDEF)-like protein
MMQKWDFAPGQNFALQMNDAINYARRLILILSNSFLISDFTKPEWAAFFAIDPTGEDGRIVPIRVEICKPTGLLRPLVYIDFVAKSEAECRARLRSGIKPGRKKPAEQPDFPGVVMETSTLAPAFPNAARRNPLDFHNDTWTRTREELEGLLRKLDRGEPQRNKAPLPVIYSRAMGRAFIREALDNYVRWLADPSLIVVDVDGMSGINKRFGVEVGDTVVQCIGALTKDIIGRIISGRLGDDTFFAIVQTGANIHDTAVASEMLLSAVRSHPWHEIALDLYVTCSAGVAQFSPTENPSATVTRAVQGVRLARSAGGNRMVRGPQFVERRSHWTALLS